MVSRMKTGFFKLNEKMYFFKIEDGVIEISNTSGINISKIFEKFNCKNEFISEIQELHVNFFPNWNKGIIFHNNTMDYIDGKERFEIIGYIEFKDNKEHEINSFEMSFKELNAFYSTNKALNEITLDDDKQISIEVNNFRDVKSEIKKIKIDNKEIEYYYYVARKLNRNNENSLTLNTFAKYSLKDKMENFKDIIKIYNKLHIFYSYISYRQNILDDRIIIYSFDENNRLYNCGTFYYTYKRENKLNNGVKEDYIYKHIINHDDILPIEEKIIQAISDKKLFIRHIPKDIIEAKQITLDRVINLTSAFEWEFDQLFPEGIKHKPGKVSKLRDLENKLNNMKLECNSLQKRIVNKTIENMYKDTLDGKLKYAYDELITFAKPILEHLINLNDVRNRDNIFKELSDLRNDYAHGHMQIDLENDGILGAVFLSRFIYVMQLYRLGLDEIHIKNSINNLHTKIFFNNIII